MFKQALVIAISGKTAAGKTTICNQLKSKLSAELVSWDDYDESSEEPSDYIKWFENGQNYDEFKRPILANDLSKLKNSNKIIIFDSPLGRLHSETGKFIDVMIHIDVPLDVLLCRRFLRDFDKNSNIEDILNELKYYCDYSRPLYKDEDLKKESDLIIDGMLSVNEKVNLILDYLNKM